MNKENKTLTQEVAECLICVFAGFSLAALLNGIFVICSVLIMRGLGDVIIIGIVIFTTYLFSTWSGIRYLSSSWRLKLLRLLSGKDALVSNVIIGPNYALYITQGKELIISDVLINSIPGMYAAVYVEGDAY